ncbi:MAG: RluA family pseudouridine synthase [Candidatus Sericytochromatia bacterium]
MNPPQYWLVAPAEAQQPLEQFLANKLLQDYLKLRKWIQAGCVSVDGQPGKASRWVQAGQKVELIPPQPMPHAAEPQDLPLPIRYQDSDLVVVAKPMGMASHPGPGWWRGSCVNALLWAIQDWPGVGGIAGPGIVHRLDRDTTGLLIFAKTDRAHQALLQASQKRQIERQYLAWVVGRFKGNSGSINQPLARNPAEPEKMRIDPHGKAALTHYQVLQSTPEGSLLHLKLETGRTHQIRVHLASLGHPVWGDGVYGQAGPFLALHAWQLRFQHPVSGLAIALCEPPPNYWRNQGFRLDLAE